MGDEKDKNDSGVDFSKSGKPIGTKGPDGAWEKS